MANVDILTLITELRGTEKYIQAIFMYGGCYRFHLFLKKLFPDAVPYINTDKTHVITEYKGKFYDITGEVDPEGFSEMTREDVEMAEKWSFSSKMALSLGECPHCGESIVV